jgi:cytochrome c oxidase cbb3-type subunit 3
MTTIVLLILLLTGCDEASEPTITAEQLQQLRSQSEAYQGVDIAQLQDNATAMQLGKTLLDVNCMQCHGENASRQIGAPNLLAGVFDYGSSAADIRTTITAGRHSLMPALGNVLGEVELGALVAYVRSFNSGEPLANFTTTATKLFTEKCVVCHGPEARGNSASGSADLTDAYWQHGSSMMNVRLTITRGVESSCPAQGGVLSSAEIEILLAYLLQLRT